MIQDPAAGTGGGVIAARHWIREREGPSLLDQAGRKHFHEPRFDGGEHGRDTNRQGIRHVSADLAGDGTFRGTFCSGVQAGSLFKPA